MSVKKKGELVPAVFFFIQRFTMAIENAPQITNLTFRLRPQTQNNSDALKSSVLFRVACQERGRWFFFICCAVCWAAALSSKCVVSIFCRM